MKYLTFEQRQELLDKYDPDDIIEILGWDSEILIDRLEKWICQELYKFGLETDDSKEEETEDN